MNHIERLFDGFAWLWIHAREPLIGLLLAGVVVLVAAASFDSPLVLLLGLAVFALSLVLAWLKGEAVDTP